MSRPNRQSSRLTAKRNQEVQAPTLSASRPNKRQRTTPQVSTVAKPSIPRVDDFKKVKGRRGKLRFMTEIPVDILLEIFSHVEPLDLLHLSWATKDLHALITASRNAFLWKRVYENLPGQQPPPCPPGKNIAQYTNLLFGRVCQFCAASHVGKIVHWAALVRTCANCACDKFLKSWGPHIDARVSALCAAQWITKGTSILPRNTYIMKSDYEWHKQRWDQCEGDIEKAAYMRKAEKDRLELYATSQLYDRWYRSQEANQLPRTEIIRRKRRDAIIAKLQDAGYTEELLRYPINFLPIVRVPTELTDKAWDKIKDELINLMEYRRQEMLKAKITQALQFRLYSLDRAVRSNMETISKPSIIPPTAYIANLEPFRTVFKTLPLQERVSEELFSEMHNTLPKMTEAWRREADISLLNLLLNASPSTSTDEVIDRAPLELATTFFKCHWCTEPITYPRILMHGCLRNRRCKDTDKEDNEEADEEEAESGTDDENEAVEVTDNDDQTLGMPRNEVTVDTVWTKMSSWFGSGWNDGNDQIFVDEEAMNFAKRIVQVCGEDPKTATFSRMEDLDPRLECLRCTAKSKTKTRKRLVMNWTTAILHDIEIHFEDDPLSDSRGWKLLTAEADISATAESEFKLSKKWRAVKKCNRCGLFIQEQYLKSHLAEVHQLYVGEDAVTKQNYHLPLDTSLKRAPFSVRI